MSANLKHRILSCLNKPIGDNFIDLLLKYAKLNDSVKFGVYCKVLGLSNDELVKEIYQTFTSSPNTSEPPTVPSKKSEKIRKKLISYDDDEVLDVKPKKSFQFKKIKKEDAIRNKKVLERDETQKSPGVPQLPQVQYSETPDPHNGTPQDLPHKTPPTPALSLQELADQELVEEQEPELPEPDFLALDLDPTADRQWYMGDEYDVAEQPTLRPRQIVRRKPTGSGGTFNEFGEYIDLDHQVATDDLSNLPISAHFFVPPFLESSKDLLTIQFNQTTNLKGTVTGISPIKNPNSLLAIMAKTGSSVVNERRTKKERAKQAKDRSSLQGTHLGNVLGIDKDPAKPTEKVTELEHTFTATEINLQRRNLPVYTVREKLLQTISDNQIVIIIGETGSGKSTQLTQYLYEEGFGKSISKDGIRQQIGCTQPRRVAAMSVAKRVSEEVGCELGKEVGYSIRFEDYTSQDTIIKYLTDGILLRELLVDPNLDNYSCIIMDEAHERSLNTDILLGLLRLLVMRRKDLKLIVTSATMNASKFADYFGNAPQFHIPGRMYPVELFYNRSTNDYVDATVKQVVTIHLENLDSDGLSDGDILVFMTGQEDIETTCEMINEKVSELDGIPPLDVYPIYSSLPSDVQRKIFTKSNQQRRKVVVATNIAETSLTVDGIKYVIDCGLVKMKIFNPKLGMDTLQMIPISQANANQRSGRAGRTGPGKAFRLYSERELNENLNLMPIPEIQRTNLNNVMLLLKSLRVKTIENFPFMDPPPSDITACSLYDLWTIGALDNQGDLTALGNQMVNFPMEPSLSKLILVSATPKFKCSLDILIIVSILSVPNVFYHPKERADEANMAREKFAVSESDHLTYLHVYQQWEAQLRKPHMTASKVSQWCTKNFLNHKLLLRARDIKIQLTTIMKKLKLPLYKSTDDDNIRKCLCACFFPQAATLLKLNLSSSNQIEYVNIRHPFMKMYLHPTSALHNSTSLPPSFVIYHELVLTSKEYMTCVTAVDPLWLLEFGYVFYGVSKLDKAKYLNFDLGFKLIEKQDFAAILRQSQDQISNPKTTVEKPRIGPKKFKKSRGV